MIGIEVTKLQNAIDLGVESGTAYGERQFGFGQYQVLQAVGHHRSLTSHTERTAQLSIVLSVASFSLPLLDVLYRTGIFGHLYIGRQ